MAKPKAGSIEQLGQQPGFGLGRHLLRLVVAFAAVCGACLLLNQNALNYFELYAYNFRMSVRSRQEQGAIQAAQGKIVLVTLDDESYAVLTEDAKANMQPPPSRPLQRHYHAKVLRDLAGAGAKAVVFDLVFAASTPDDNELAKAASGGCTTVWACWPQTDDNGEQTLVLPTRALTRASSLVGHCLTIQDYETTLCDRIPAVVKTQGRRIPALSLLAAAASNGAQRSPLNMSLGRVGLGSVFAPADDNGCFRISFIGGPGSTFASIPYYQLYQGAASDPFYRENAFFKDKVVLIGDTTTSGRDRDHYTPVGLMDGVEVHAHAIATLLEQRFVVKAPPWADVLAVALLTAAVCLLAVAGSPYTVAAGAAAAAACYFLLNVWLFARHGIWLSLVAPMLAAAMGAAGMLGERAVSAEVEKKRMRWLLRRYVSPEVADYIIANPDACVLGGKRVEASVLFADIRGFAGMSEHLTPELAVRVLNDYFDEMTAAAFRHGGTVDKFVGDAIMVLAGVPVPYPDHARRAVAIALDMESTLLALQERLSADGLPTIDIRIGINSGTMVAGSIGSSQRLDFTVIGDDVNCAARVTDLNKQFGTRILMTDATYRLVQDDVVARGPLSGVVKGKNLEAYEVRGWQVTAGGAHNQAAIKEGRP